MFPISDWPRKSPTSSFKTPSDLLDTKVSEPPDFTLTEMLDRSDKFPIEFPINSVRCKTLKNDVDENVLERNVNSSYPLLYENVLQLYADFILHKRRYGCVQERELYKNMTVLELVERLLTKRAVMFMGRLDDYILLDGTKGRGKWETIGKENETNLKLTDCLSYDEIKLSAFLSVSSYTHFINDGNRKNKGIAAKSRTDIQDEGIIIGLIGARMKKKFFMEYQDIIISKEQNTEARGYGTQFAPTLQSVFAGFYEKTCQTYDNFSLTKNNHEVGYFNEISKDVYFDNVTYAKRIALSIDTLLFEANQRAKERNTTAYIHMVGIGLGVWRCSDHQEGVFMETFAKRLEILGENLHSISDVDFSYFSKSSSCGKYQTGSKVPIATHPKNGIKIILSRRQPHVKLTGEDEGKLLVVTYAWDGNSLPGNEFWSGMLASTGDSAAASSTQITELHNPHINPKVSARNLRIATRDGVVPFSKYVTGVSAKDKKRKLEDDVGPSTM